MHARKRTMHDLDFLSNLRLVMLFCDAHPLFKGRVAQHTKLHHLTVGDLHRTICILAFQNVKGRSAIYQER